MTSLEDRRTRVHHIDIAHAAGAASEVDHVLHVMQGVEVGAADSAGERSDEDLALIRLQIGDFVTDQLLVAPDDRPHCSLPSLIAHLAGAWHIP